MEFSDIDPDCMVAEDIIRHVTGKLFFFSEYYGPHPRADMREKALDLLASIAEALLSMPAQERMDILEDLSRHHD